MYLPQDDTPTSPTGVFTRSRSGGVISVKGNSGGNIYPPAPIRDLAITDILNGDSFNLTFTSPGEDLNTGTVAEYKIFYATNRTQLEDLSPSSNVSVVTEDMLKCNLTLADCSLEPQPALTPVNLRLNSTFFLADTDYSFRVLAVDAGQLTSVSNVAVFAPSFNVPASATNVKISQIFIAVMFLFAIICY